MRALFKNLLIVMVCFLMAITIASADDKTSYITVEPDLLEILVGEVGTFNVTLNTESYDDGSMEYDTLNDSLHAQLVNSSGGVTAYGRTGSIDFTIPSGSDKANFTLNVKPLDGIVCYELYNVTVTFKTTTGIAKTMATADIIPVSELITLGLMSIGVLALLGLVIRQQRKD